MIFVTTDIELKPQFGSLSAKREELSEENDLKKIKHLEGTQGKDTENRNVSDIPLLSGLKQDSL